MPIQGKKIPLEVGKKFQSHGHYVDYRTREMINQAHPMDLPKFRIIDTLIVYNWHLIDEEKIVLGKKCKKAVTESQGQMITAWYDTSQHFSIGPSLLNGLPGLILEANYQRPIITIRATLITEGNPIIYKPDDGKEISYEEYQKALIDRNKKLEKQKVRETVIRVY